MSIRNRTKREQAGEQDFGVLEWSGGERSEPKRNGRTPKSAAVVDRDKPHPPDPEVLEKPSRRRFTTEYKARIVQEADGCTEMGQVGALLRREGLYSSQLAQWRKQYRAGGYAALGNGKRGRKRKKSALELENERLQRQVSRLESRLEQAEAIIDIQKKASAMLGIPLKALESDGTG